MTCYKLCRNKLSWLHQCRKEKRRKENVFFPQYFPLSPSRQEAETRAGSWQCSLAPGSSCSSDHLRFSLHGVKCLWYNTLSTKREHNSIPAQSVLVSPFSSMWQLSALLFLSFPGLIETCFRNWGKPSRMPPSGATGCLLKGHILCVLHFALCGKEEPNI